MPEYPDVEPYETGLLDTGDGNFVYWETCGNPDGVPALIVHGGPGSGCTAGQRRSLDPEKFRIILFDQRSCGRSLPHASDPAADMSLNTTGHLLMDMEQLREHLGVQKWLLRGASWGGDAVAGVCAAVSGASRRDAHAQRDLDQAAGDRLAVPGRGPVLPRGVGRFVSFAGLAGTYRLPTDSTPPITRLLAAYSQMMEDPDLNVRSRAAAEWTAWEDA
ncbi:MAG: alpha/beta fold hydrolase, partial [Nocardiopsaceae bacterium]|nr:alpha/beta fold hydrolase [Nocardiopsaceae bacterium]